MHEQTDLVELFTLHLPTFIVGTTGNGPYKVAPPLTARGPCFSACSSCSTRLVATNLGFIIISRSVLVAKSLENRPGSQPPPSGDLLGSANVLICKIVTASFRLHLSTAVLLFLSSSHSFSPAGGDWSRICREIEKTTTRVKRVVEDRPSCQRDPGASGSTRRRADETTGNRVV